MGSKNYLSGPTQGPLITQSQSQTGVLVESLLEVAVY